MTKYTELVPSFLDAETLCGLNPESLDYAKKAYTTWCETAADIQGHATRFLNNRLAKDSAAIAQFGRCRTPLEVFNVQFEYVRNVFADFVDEGQKAVAYFGDMATQGMLHEPMDQLSSAPQSKEAGKSKRSPHRVATH